MGRGALDRRTTLAATKSLVVCLVVAVMHVALWRMGPLRLVLDLAVYVIAALGLGIVRFQDVRALVRMLRTRSARS
jgi:uncharacterized membrane protein YdfJ with MMPL/SSD domain